MTLSQSARFKAYGLALAHLKENEEITKEMPAFAEAYAAAKATLDAVAAAENLRQQNRQAIKVGKQQFRDDIANRAMEIAAAIVTYASGKNELQLKAAMNFTRSELVHVSDPELGAKTANILAAAKALNGQLTPFGITEEVLTRYEAMVDQYLVAANEPRNTTAMRKQAGQVIRDGLNELRDKLKNQLDKLMLQYRSSHPDFYNQYIVKRTVVNPGQRKTQLEGQVTDKDSKSGLGDVQVLVKDTPLVTETLADGTFILKMPPVSNAEVVFKKKGYRSFTVLLDVKRGQKARQAVELEKGEEAGTQ